ncbi:MAG: hypothetical protein ACRBCL_11690 [Maritimibacter sp.]
MVVLSVLWWALPYAVMSVLLWALRRELRDLRPKAAFELTVAIALHVFTLMLALGTFTREPALLIYMDWSALLAAVSTAYALILVLVRRDGGVAMHERAQWIYGVSVAVFVGFVVFWRMF